MYDEQEDVQLHGLGYPKVSSASRQTRSPYGWWDSQERINFNELVPENDDIQSMWAPDVPDIKPSSAAFQISVAFSLIGLFALTVYATMPGPPALPRAYPYGGLVMELSGTDDPLYAARPDSANVIEE